VFSVAHAPYRKADWKLIAQGPAASRLIERGIAGPGLLAHVLVAQYADHPPLYLQSVIYGHEGVELEHSLPANSVGAASMLLRPAYAGLNAVYETGRVVEAVCCAHARRKSYDLNAARRHR
jgi:transposase